MSYHVLCYVVEVAISWPWIYSLEICPRSGKQNKAHDEQNMRTLVLKLGITLPLHADVTEIVRSIKRCPARPRDAVNQATRGYRRKYFCQLHN